MEPVKAKPSAHRSFFNRLFYKSPAPPTNTTSVPPAKISKSLDPKAAAPLPVVSKVILIKPVASEVAVPKPLAASEPPAPEPTSELHPTYKVVANSAGKSTTSVLKTGENSIAVVLNSESEIVEPKAGKLVGPSGETTHGLVDKEAASSNLPYPNELLPVHDESNIKLDKESLKYDKNDTSLESFVTAVMDITDFPVQSNPEAIAVEVDIKNFLENDSHDDNKAFNHNINDNAGPSQTPNSFSEVISPTYSNHCEPAEYISKVAETSGNIVEESVAGSTEALHKLAEDLYAGLPTFIDPLELASYLGTDTAPDCDNAILRQLFFSFFNFAGKSILGSIRALCTKLYMKAESQQLDKIIDSFSDRWILCNPTHLFRDATVVYTIAYSIILLNTDLNSNHHSISKKMTKHQYIDQTYKAIKLSLAHSARIKTNKSSKSTVIPVKSQSTTPTMTTITPTISPSSSFSSSSFTSSIPSKKETTPPAAHTTISESEGNSSWIGHFRNDSKLFMNPLVDYFDNITLSHQPDRLMAAPTDREWNIIVKILLKSIYLSISMQPLALKLFDNDISSSSASDSISSSNSTIETSYQTGMFRTLSSTKRKPSTGSVYSGISSWSHDSGNTNHSNDNQKNSKSNYASTHRSSLLSLQISPSNHSLDFFGRPDEVKVGFTSTLWNAIIREENEKLLEDSCDSIDTKSLNGFNESFSLRKLNSRRSSVSYCQYNYPSSHNEDPDEPPALYLAENQEFEILGPPWAKEGLVKFQTKRLKLGKKLASFRRDGDFVETFMVVQRGFLSIFQFDGNKKEDTLLGSPSGLGDGNWVKNSSLILSVSLCHTFAQLNPPFFQSKTSGNYWSVTLPSSSSKSSFSSSSSSSTLSPLSSSASSSQATQLIFKSGTKEISQEFVYVCNYWAARVSTDPLIESISNVEYGWGKLLTDLESYQSGAPTSLFDDTVSIRSFSTVKSSSTISRSATANTNSDYSLSHKPKRVHIKEWTPNSINMSHSKVGELEQLAALNNYIKSFEDALSDHDDLRSRIVDSYHPNPGLHPNPTSSSAVISKVLANWERKKNWLLSEMVKFNIYYRNLQRAIDEKSLHVRDSSK